MKIFQKKERVVIFSVILGVLTFYGCVQYRESKYKDHNTIPSEWQGVWKSNDHWDFHENHEKLLIDEDSMVWNTSHGNTALINFERIQSGGQFPKLELRLRFSDPPSWCLTDSRGWNAHLFLEDLQMFKMYCTSCSKFHSISLLENPVK